MWGILGELLVDFVGAILFEKLPWTILIAIVVGVLIFTFW